MDLNKGIIMGNVGQDPKYHDMRDNEQLCKFSVATSRKWKNKNTGEQMEDTQWHNVVIFNKYLVTICKQYVQKGTRVYIEGEIKTRSYDKDGHTNYITELTVPAIKGELIVIARGKGWDEDAPRHSADQSSDEFRDQLGDNYGKEEYDDDIPF
jgi:single-strand DNA-binding protein